MASIHSMPRAAGSANKNSNCKRITINLSESCYGRCWNGTHVFISPAHCHSDSVFMITSIKHTQFLICFLISLNKSLVFPHKKIRRKQSQKGWKDEKWKREGKRGRRLDEGEVERETVLLLTAWDFSFLQKLKANIYPFFFVCVFPKPQHSVCVTKSAWLLPSPFWRPLHLPPSRHQEDQSWRIFRMLGYIQKHTQTQFGEVQLKEASIVMLILLLTSSQKSCVLEQPQSLWASPCCQRCLCLSQEQTVQPWRTNVNKI